MTPLHPFTIIAAKVTIASGPGLTMLIATVLYKAERYIGVWGIPVVEKVVPRRTFLMDGS